MPDEIEYKGFDTNGTSIDDAFLIDFEDDVDESIEDDYSENDYE